MRLWHRYGIGLVGLIVGFSMRLATLAGPGRSGSLPGEAGSL